MNDQDRRNQVVLLMLAYGLTNKEAIALVEERSE